MNTKTKNQTKSKRSVESYYQTSNEWHNKNVIRLIAKIKREDTFNDLSLALDFYNYGLNLFENNPQLPLYVLEKLEKEFIEYKINEEQKVCILESIKQYIGNSTFEKDQNDETLISDEMKDAFLTVFKAELDRTKDKIEESKPKETNQESLRSELKEIVFGEVKELGNHLEKLEPKEKLNFLCKLMPFVISKEKEHTDVSRNNEFDFFDRPF